MRAAGLLVLVVAICLTVVSVPLRLTQIGAVCTDGSCAQGQLSLEGARTAKSYGLSLGVYAAFTAAFDVAAVATYFVVALALLWRKGTERMAFLVALLWVGLGLDTFPLGTLAAEWPAWDRVVAVNYSLSIGVLLVLFAALFPDGRFVPRWMRWAVAVAAAEELVRLAFPSSPLSPSSRPEELQVLENVGWIMLLVAAQVYRYRRVSGPVQRQQTKWVVLAFAVVLGLNVAVGLLPLVAPVAGQQGSPAALAVAAALDVSLIFTPLAIGVAMLRHRLFDIDLLINRALLYSALTASLALAYAGSVIVLQAIFRGVTGQESNVSIAISTLAIAALFGPVRRRLQDFVDRRFYRRRYDASRAFEAFATRVRDEVDLDVLTREMLAVLAQTTQPAHASVWLRASPKTAGRQGAQSASPGGTKGS